MMIDDDGIDNVPISNQFPLSKADRNSFKNIKEVERIPPPPPPITKKLAILYPDIPQMP